VIIQQLHCNQPIMFLPAWRGRFFGYHINQPSMDGAAFKRSVFCEFDRRENEQCLYTGLIVLEEAIRMVVLLLLLSF